MPVLWGPVQIVVHVLNELVKQFQNNYGPDVDKCDKIKDYVTSIDLPSYIVRDLTYLINHVTNGDPNEHEAAQFCMLLDNVCECLTLGGNKEDQLAKLKKNYTSSQTLVDKQQFDSPYDHLKIFEIVILCACSALEGFDKSTDYWDLCLD